MIECQQCGMQMDAPGIRYCPSCGVLLPGREDQSGDKGGRQPSPASPFEDLVEELNLNLERQNGAADKEVELTIDEDRVKEDAPVEAKPTSAPSYRVIGAPTASRQSPKPHPVEIPPAPGVEMAPSQGIEARVPADEPMHFDPDREPPAEAPFDADSGEDELDLEAVLAEAEPELSRDAVQRSREKEDALRETELDLDGAVAGQSPSGGGTAGRVPAATAAGRPPVPEIPSVAPAAEKVKATSAASAERPAPPAREAARTDFLSPVTGQEAAAGRVVEEESPSPEPVPQSPETDAADDVLFPEDEGGRQTVLPASPPEDPPVTRRRGLPVALVITLLIMAAAGGYFFGRTTAPPSPAGSSFPVVTAIAPPAGGGGKAAPPAATVPAPRAPAQSPVAVQAPRDDDPPDSAPPKPLEETAPHPPLAAAGAESSLPPPVVETAAVPAPVPAADSPPPLPPSEETPVSPEMTVAAPPPAPEETTAGRAAVESAVEPKRPSPPPAPQQPPENLEPETLADDSPTAEQPPIAAEGAASGSSGEQDWFLYQKSDQAYWTIQLATFTTLEKARDVMARFQTRGFPVYVIEKRNRNGRPYYHLRSGKFGSRAEAAEAAEPFHTRMLAPYIIVRSQALTAP